MNPVKKTKLIISPEYNFELIGLISSIKFYKLAWAINNKLDIRLVKQEDYVIEANDNRRITFTNYKYQEEYGNFQLFKNRAETGNDFLIPETSKVDYILKLEGNTPLFDKENVLPLLKGVSWIEFATVFDMNKLKSKDNFLT